MGLESPCCHATSDGHRAGDDIPDDEPPPLSAKSIEAGAVQRRCADCGDWSYIGEWTHIEDTSEGADEDA